MCAPVWATAQLESRFRLMPLRRADQLAVGTCSDRSCQGFDSSWTSLADVAIQDWQFPMDGPTRTRLWWRCAVHPLLIAVAWQTWRSGVTTDRRVCGCNSQVLTPTVPASSFDAPPDFEMQVASLQEQAHARGFFFINVRQHLQMNLTWLTQWRMTSAQIMLKMVRRVFVKVKDLWWVPKLARYRTHQSNARFQAEMSGTAAAFPAALQSLDGVSLVRRVHPSPLHHEISSTYRKAMRAVMDEANCGVSARQERGWKLFVLFRRLLLVKNARGGTLGKEKFAKRFDMFVDGEWAELFRSSRKCAEDMASLNRRRQRRGLTQILMRSGWRRP